MKSIFHSDNWVEIPEGECLLGISQEQREFLWDQMKQRSEYKYRPPHEQQQMDDLIEQARQATNLGMVIDHNRLFSSVVIPSFFHIPQRSIRLKRFYISRFPITDTQYDLLRRLGTPVADIPGTLEEPETYIYEGKSYYGRCGSEVQTDIALEYCKQLEGRLPTADEWEKAARGTDGRLYPWGNQWDQTRGFFYYGQSKPKECGGGKPPVDAYPSGVSPYGVWNMAGGLPEMVTVPLESYRPVFEYNGQQIATYKKGCHPRESSIETAYLDHLVAENGSGDWVTFRPVLDKWPKQQWQGVNVSEI